LVRRRATSPSSTTGKVYQGNPRNVPLVDKAQIQLDVGTPLIAPDLIAFPKRL
jgi:hypothetical protein